MSKKNKRNKKIVSPLSQQDAVKKDAPKNVKKDALISLPISDESRQESLGAHYNPGKKSKKVSGDKSQSIGSRLKILLSDRKRRRQLVLALLGGSIILVTFFVVRGLETTQTLDWDESVYALKARGWVEGTPDDSFYVYRPLGLPAVSLAFAQVAGWFGLETFSPDTLRLFGVFFSCLAAGMLFAFTARVSNLWIALTTTVVVVGSTLFLRNAPLLQNDVASTGLLLGVMWCIWSHYLSNGRNHYLYGAVILAIVAFYVRYGVALHLFVIGVATMILFLLRVYGRQHLRPLAEDSTKSQKISNKGRFATKQKSAQREEFYFNPTLKALVLFVVLLVPHIIQSLMLFERNPLGILLYAGDAANREFLGEGLLDYIAWIPTQQAGPFVGALALIGIFSLFALFFSRPDLRTMVARKELTGMYWMMSIALTSLVLIGLIAHAEERYILFPLALFVFAGIWSVSLIVRFFVPRLHRVTIGAIFLYGLYVGSENIAITNALYAVQTDYRQPIVAAGKAIKADAASEACFVWSAEEPQTSWHSGCRVFTYNPENIIEYLNIYRNKQKYITVYNETDKVQPDIAALAALGVVLYPVEIATSRDDRAEVYRVFYSGDGGDRLQREQ